MEIDIYLKWDGITNEEEKKQSTGFSLTNGHRGYLRHSYYKPKNYIGDYPIKLLVPEGFEDSDNTASIYAEEMECRLPAVIANLKKFYSNAEFEDGITIKDIINSYINFVALAKQKELETGTPCTIVS